jgi:glycosyltransferase involved in cell wall biosynthesis
VNVEVPELPRVLMVGRTRYTLPLPGWLARKFDALERQLDYRVVASAEEGSPTTDAHFRLLPPVRPRFLDGLLFYVRCPFAIRRQVREFRPQAIIAESPYTAAAALLARSFLGGARPRVVVEVHGDWRTATRLYGSPRRKLLSPLADAVSSFAVRRSDAVRALSRYTESLVEEVRGIPVTAAFAAYMDLSAFTARPLQPLPERPTALFVGMLEAYKYIDGLAEAWRRVAPELPEARLVIVGKGSRRAVVEQLVSDLPDQVEWVEQIPPAEVAARVDAATVLVLPSRSEGLGRVIVETFARGRGLVASAVGGIPDVARDGQEAILVEPENVDALADALRRVLTDRPLAERLGAAALERFRSWHVSPAEYAAQVRSLVDASLRADPVAGERPRVLHVTARGVEDAAARALREEIELHVLDVGRSWLRWPLVPLRVGSATARLRPAAVVAESPYLGFLVLLGTRFFRRGGRRPSVIVEMHEDWRAATRLSGARGRLLLSPVADRAARYTLRRADALRALSPYTAGLARREADVPPLESFATYSDLSAFVAQPRQPLPESPTALYVGMLERTKGVTTLAAAWPLVAARVPQARLVIVGRGAQADVVAGLLDDFPVSVVHVERLQPGEVAAAMDAATCLVLPSRSEGLPRVILEAFARGRAVVASRVGGVGDLVADGENGLLVESGDVDALAAAIERVLLDHELAERLGAAAHASSRRLELSADDYAARVRSLVDRTLAGTRP